MNSFVLMAIVSVWVCIWIICRHIVIALHRRYIADLEIRARIRREYRAELAARRARVRVRGCTCTACHTLTPVVPGSPRR